LSTCASLIMIFIWLAEIMESAEVTITRRIALCESFNQELITCSGSLINTFEGKARFAQSAAPGDR
jgi:hypothetical protein